jgi:hypothetical protein
MELKEKLHGWLMKKHPLEKVTRVVKTNLGKEGVGRPLMWEAEGGGLAAREEI